MLFRVGECQLKHSCRARVWGGVGWGVGCYFPQNEWEQPIVPAWPHLRLLSFVGGVYWESVILYTSALSLNLIFFFQRMIVAGPHSVPAPSVGFTVSKQFLGNGSPFFS